MLKRIFSVAAVVLAVAVPAMAQQSTADTPTKDLSMVSEKEVKGSAIRNAAGEKIGTVDHVVVDQSTGRVKYAVIGVGGFLGMGQKDVAVPWDRIQASDQAQTYVLNVDKDTLRNAPTVDPKNLQALDQPQTQSTIASYWQKAASQQAQTPEKGGKIEKKENKGQGE
ncbi:MAG: PRC-barrel domain-containing protein [Magnetospirillum sp.]|nr:PRC-barrel domain-containing protein [Magnetospirillum sp.]